MPAHSRGSIFKARDGYGIRWSEDGRRPQQTGFKTKRQARDWFDEHVAARLRRGGPSAEIAFDAFCEIYLDRWGTGVTARTQSTVNAWLAPARERFGDWQLRELEGAVDDVARWRAAIKSPDARHKNTRAFRQVLAAAVRWGYIHRNPALDCGPNHEPRREEIRPLTAAQIAAICAELAPSNAAIVAFARETGLRTNEWVALERRDIDRSDLAVVVVRRYADGVLTPFPKTGMRRVPLTDAAFAALDSVPPRIDTPLVFPAAQGGYIDLDNWRLRDWYPALDAAGVPKCGPYVLRHTFATEALAADVSIHELARLMGASVKTIDKHYGHLAHDSIGRLRARLSARSGVNLASSDTDEG